MEPQALFGVVVPGNPVLTNIQQVDNGKWLAVLGFAPSTFMAFLTQTQPVPPGYGISVYIGREGSSDFQYLGYLAEGRPSSLFQVPAVFLDAAQPTRVVLGLSLERQEDIMNLGVTVHQPMQQIEAATRKAIAERLLEDFYTFITSYGRTVDPNQPLLGLNADEEYVFVPASFVDKWRKRVDVRIQKDQSMLQ